MIELCAGYGCPLLGVLGSSGKWYCGCHFNTDPNLNDAITAELYRRPDTVEKVVLARRSFRTEVELETALIRAVKDAISQQSLPMEGAE